MNVIRIVIAFPLSLAVYGLSVIILSLGPYFLLGRDVALTKSFLNQATWLVDGLSAFLCIVVGALVVPKRSLLTTSYALSLLPTLILLKDITRHAAKGNTSAHVSQEVIGIALGVILASLYLRRRLSSKAQDDLTLAPSTIVTSPAFIAADPHQNTQVATGNKLQQAGRYAFFLFAIVFVLFELRSAERVNTVRASLWELFGIESPSSAPAQKPTHDGPPPMAPDEAQRFKASADTGDAYAQFRTGVIYQFGLGGFPKNAVEAARYYRLAVDQENWKATTNLGLLYLSGAEGLPKDEIEAAWLLKLGADSHDTVAQYWLGRMYLNGQGGLPKDDLKADQLIKLSRDDTQRQGSTSAPQQVQSEISPTKGCSCGNTSFHSGVDYQGKPGTPIPVADDGIVIRIELDQKTLVLAPTAGACGRYIVVKHTYANGRSVFTRYGQLGNLATIDGSPLAVGMHLKKDATIASTGSTGFFHFEVRPVSEKENGVPPAYANDAGFEWLQYKPVDPRTFDFEKFKAASGGTPQRHKAHPLSKSN